MPNHWKLIFTFAFQGDSVLKIQYLVDEKLKNRPDGPTVPELSQLFHTPRISFRRRYFCHISYVICILTVLFAVIHFVSSLRHNHCRLHIKGNKLMVQVFKSITSLKLLKHMYMCFNILKLDFAFVISHSRTNIYILLNILLHAWPRMISLCYIGICVTAGDVSCT